MDPMSGSIWSTYRIEDSPTHKPPYSLNPAEVIPTLRSKVIRRQSNRLFPSSHWLIEMMEERLVRWRPTSSQNSVSLVLDGNHPYQKEALAIREIVEPEKNTAPENDSVRNDTLIFDHGKPEQLLGTTTLRWIQDLNNSFDLDDMPSDFQYSNSFRCMGTTTVIFGRNPDEDMRTVTASPLDFDRHVSKLTEGETTNRADGLQSQFIQNESPDQDPWYSWIFGCY
ncbi:hypothetical protein KL905_002330 [Ogataea polymorpha]|nr:hypothetical protein KL936_002726 [Ogataea polymorpha]KAG7922308.1 hypothetical protein KL905_002330 [Ogataea polymorpha]KAG7926664.1 hypothetical protein KL925_002949 [Ogataea polymorpha]KAG7936501.1 hypothetical protein KL934_001968 [Ogataea polymorpha]